MHAYSLGHLADGTLLLQLSELVARDRTNTAALLAHLAEVDERKLFAPAGYPSMHLYCLRELRLSEDAAFKRIQVARLARDIPAIFEEVAEGRLHLSGLVLLAAHLTPDNAHALLSAAAHKTKSEIAVLIAGRFPAADQPDQVRAITPVSVSGSLAPGRVNEPSAQPDSRPAADLADSLAAGQVNPTSHSLAPGQVRMREEFPKICPVSPQRFALQTTINQATHDKLRRAQELLGSAIPSGDLAQVLDRALDALILQLEKRRFGVTSKPRAGEAPANIRHIPAHVRRAVRERDAGRCTFVSQSGHRCEARKFIEYDHIEPVARGGNSTVANLRLRCRAHNQYEAEREFGAGFMRQKRDAARGPRTKAEEQAAAEAARAIAPLVETTRIEVAQSEATRIEAAEKARAATEIVRAAAEAHAAAARLRPPAPLTPSRAGSSARAG